MIVIGVRICGVVVVCCGDMMIMGFCVWGIMMIVIGMI